MERPQPPKSMLPRMTRLSPKKSPMDAPEVRLPFHSELSEAIISASLRAFSKEAEDFGAARKPEAATRNAVKRAMKVVVFMNQEYPNGAS